MLIILRSFLMITNAVMMVNDDWPPVILSADIHSSYLHLQKKKRKKCFLHSYHSVLLLIHSQIFNFSFVICYILFSVFSSFFHSWCMWMCISYTRVKNSCTVISKSQKQNYIESMAYHKTNREFKSLAKLYPTYKTKQWN